jgi:hypothetical protein
MTLEFTKTELNKMMIHAHDVDITNFDDKELPNDIHMVEYTIDNTTCFDAVRSYKMSDIFDAYYDKLKPLGGSIVSIKSGYGKIQAKFYNSNPPKEE